MDTSNIKIGDKLQIHCYKHDGSLHRKWDEAVVLDILPDYIVFGNNKTQVTEAEGNVWKTKEPAIMYFFKDKWFNVIAQLKKDGIYYYCNIASPFIIEEGTIKYIDYDLDLRIFPDGTFRVLDKGEYEYHKEKMHYSNEIDKIVNTELNNLIAMYMDKIGPFDEKFLQKYYNIYKETSKKRINLQKN